MYGNFDNNAVLVRRPASSLFGPFPREEATDASTGTAPTAPALPAFPVRTRRTATGELRTSLIGRSLTGTGQENAFLLRLPNEVLTCLISYLPNGAILNLALTNNWSNTFFLQALYERPATVHFTVTDTNVRIANGTILTPNPNAHLPGTWPLIPPDGIPALHTPCHHNTNLSRALKHALRRHYARPLSHVVYLSDPAFLAAHGEMIRSELDYAMRDRNIHWVMGRKKMVSKAIEMGVLLTGDEEGEGVENPMEGLLEEFIKVGEQGCAIHDVFEEGRKEESCFLDLLRFAKEKKVLSFRGVTAAQLASWIKRLPKQVRLESEYLLATAEGSPLSWP
ncbi:hypothetical protein N0V88_006185 [Collariella sp. IMI 366227]|nr:hypothetical protein N0V88_006185 [Collariella sp. IMI 366227]